MSNWLYENQGLVTIVLGTGVVVLLAVWYRRQRWWWAAAAGGLVALIALVWLLVSFSDYKQIEHAVQEMSAGVQRRDLGRIFANVSDQFRQGTPTFSTQVDRQAFRQASERVITQRAVEDVRVWDFEPEGVSQETRTARMEFKVKPVGGWSGEAAYYLCKAEFVRDPDGKWRMRGFQIFNPFVESQRPLQVPGF